MRHPTTRPRRSDRIKDPAPTPEEVAQAREAVENTDFVSGKIPDLRAIRTLERAGGFPVKSGRVTLRTARITDGRPDHGALMSAAHVSRVEAEFPLPEKCDECGAETAVLKYRRHHNIAGGWSVFCLRCEEQIDGEEWG